MLTGEVGRQGGEVRWSMASNSFAKGMALIPDHLEMILIVTVFLWWWLSSRQGITPCHTGVCVHVCVSVRVRSLALTARPGSCHDCLPLFVSFFFYIPVVASFPRPMLFLPLANDV